MLALTTTSETLHVCVHLRGDPDAFRRAVFGIRERTASD
jgi:hypothetical protein